MEKWCAAPTVVFHVMFTSVVLSIFLVYILFYHAFQIKIAQIFFTFFFLVLVTVSLGYEVYRKIYI